MCQETLRLARELAHPFSLVVVLTWFAMLHQFRRDPQQAQAWSEEAMEISLEQSFQNWYSVAGLVRGGALAEQGRQEEGKDQISESAALAQAIGTRIWRPYGLFLLAKAHDGAGRPVDAQEALAEALTLAEKTGERFCDSEFRRTKGEMLLGLSVGDQAEAEVCFRQALDIAREQEAKSLELRAALSMGRLLQQQGKRNEARQLLADVYDWFSEGFDTADLQEAKALLEDLGPKTEPVE